jgi:hypothetical protein
MRNALSRMYRSSRSDQWSTYQTSSLMRSAQGGLLRPWIQAQPAICAGERGSKGAEGQGSNGESTPAPWHPCTPAQRGADDAHVPLEDIEQLRNLVQRPVAQEVAYASDAGIVLGYLQPQALVLGAHDHGTELVAAEDLAVLAHPLLDVEHRATVVELDGQGDEGHEGGEQGQYSQGDDDVEGTLESKLNATVHAYVSDLSPPHPTCSYYARNRATPSCTEMIGMFSWDRCGGIQTMFLPRPQEA